MIKSIEPTSKKDWFRVNGDIDVHFFEEEGQIKAEAEYDTDEYTEDYVSQIVSEALNVILESITEKNKSSCESGEGNQCF